MVSKNASKKYKGNWHRKTPYQEKRQIWILAVLNWQINQKMLSKFGVILMNEKNINAIAPFRVLTKKNM